MATDRISLLSWIWRSYARSALLPLVFVEIVFLSVYVLANRFSLHENLEAIRSVADNELRQLAEQSARAIDSELGAIAQATDLFRRQTERALKTPFDPGEAERGRYAPIHDGVAFATIEDNGGAAAFYSGIVPVGPEQREKAYRTAQLDPLMRDLKQTFPTIAQLYLNTHDSLNRIYPYFDVATQYPPKMDIPSYNFYFEADALHNPSRGVVWTEAYVDPAGQGWMSSAIAPAYTGETLAAVVGLDVTISTIAKRLTALQVPWDGYAILISRSGTILAMPPSAETDFNLEELTSHGYEEYVLEDTYKPSDFQLSKRPELAAIADEILTQRSGSGSVDIGSDRLLSWSTVDTTGWKLLVLAPLETIYAPSNALGERLFAIGGWMVAGLVLFYVVFFAWLYRRSRSMAAEIQDPLAQIGALVAKISTGEYSHRSPELHVRELQTTADAITAMGRTLGTVNQELDDSRRDAERARDVALESSRLKSQFLATVSHEIRTPLAVIVGSAEILHDELVSGELSELVASLDTASRSLTELIDDLLDFSRLENGELSLHEEPFDLAAKVRKAVDMLRLPAQQKGVELELVVEAGFPVEVVGDARRFQQVTLNLVRNAVRFTDQGKVTVELHSEARPPDGSRPVVMAVRDTGIGIAEDDLPKLFQPFVQVAADPAQRRGGTGLGLSICRRIVEAMGGRIEAESRLGEGSVFTVIVPFDRNASHAPRREEVG